MSSKNILITSCGRRVSLIKAFKLELLKYFPKASVYVTDSLPELSSGVQLADKFFKTRKINEKGYLEELIKICNENYVKIIIPTIDTELEILSKNRNLLISEGIFPLVSDFEMIKIFNNKIKTHDFFLNHQINVAKVYNKNSYNLPLFIKLIDGHSSIGTSIIYDENDFTKKHFLDDRYIFCEYLDKSIYDEYTVDMYYDKNGELKCVIPRLRIEIRCGEVSKGLTKKGNLQQFVINNLSNLSGVRGCITAQFFVNKINNKIIGIEINPRFGGGYPLAYLAGANFPKMIIEEYLMNKKIERFNDWEENLLMLRYDDEILVHDFKD